jgi:hypothetical protein
MGGGIGCFDSYNIVSWKQTQIVLSGLQANRNIEIVVAVTNPQTRQVSALFTVTPNTIALTRPTIRSVTFAGSGKNLHMTITGSGFGTAPPGVPGEVISPFLSFIDRPFDSGQWQAGYAGCGNTDFVALDYAIWSDTMIVISGFGRQYGRGPLGQHRWTVAPGDLATIAVANSGTGGLEIGYTSNPIKFGRPLGTGEFAIMQLP